DIPSMEALSAASGDVVYLSDALRAGTFAFDDSDLSSEVTGDPNQGVYVALGSDSTGASGAWKRIFFGPILVSWFGANADGITDDGPAILAARDFCWANGNVTLCFPDGNYAFSGILRLARQNWSCI